MSVHRCVSAQQFSQEGHGLLLPRSGLVKQHAGCYSSLLILCQHVQARTAGWDKAVHALEIAATKAESSKHLSESKLMKCYASLISYNIGYAAPESGAVTQHWRK